MFPLVSLTPMKTIANLIVAAAYAIAVVLFNDRNAIREANGEKQNDNHNARPTA